MAIGEKLYPPIIGGTLPAFYNDGGTATIAVPFSMNRAVNSDDIYGLRIKIKTVQSNTLIRTIDTQNMSNGIAKFYWENFDENNANSKVKKIKIGQYLKVQMAYISTDQTIGYFSTVAIIKYTTKPNVFIEGLADNINRIQAFRSNYIGVYETGEDKSERPYSYNFSLYDYNGNLVETSGWQLHNTSINNIASESLSLDRATDTYTFNTAVNVNIEYFIQYSVRTINNLEIQSPLYTCLEPDIGSSQFLVDLNAENVFEEGYIRVFFTLKEGRTFLTANQLKRMYHTEYVEGETTFYVYRDAQKTQLIAGPLTYVSLLHNPISVEICRAEKTDNFSSWRVMTRMYFSDYEYAINSWDFKDFTIEQGVTYKYCFRQYNKEGIQSSRTLSNEVYGDYEDMFLWDGKKQLKIRFNPKVSSFKTTRLESKFDTIGNRYPFIFRNGIVEYKEFPIAGLISYLADNNELFLNHQEDLNIVLSQHATRLGRTLDNLIYQKATPVDQTLNDISLGKSWENTQTLDSVGYNMRAERRFKLKLLDWLGNGEIKMFKSPAEGNYLIRLLNISLTPEDRLGRMLHNFSATAYEMAEFTYENLVDLGFLNPSDMTSAQLDMKTVKFIDAVAALGNSINTASPMINEATIFEYARIETSPNGIGGPGFYVRIGQNNADAKVYVQPGFFLQSENSVLPNIYFCAQDNLDLIRNLYSDNTINSVTYEQVQSLLGDAQLTYRYYNSSMAIGEFFNIKDVYLTNTVETLIGPYNKDFIVDMVGLEKREVIKFFVLNFKEKPVRPIVISGSGYVDKLNETAQVTDFDPLSLYEIFQKSNGVYTSQGIYQFRSNTESAYVCATEAQISHRVELNTSEGLILSYDEVPVINTSQFVYTNINIGNGVYLECAYQEKVTEYKGSE